MYLAFTKILRWTEQWWN